MDFAAGCGSCGVGKGVGAGAAPFDNVPFGLGAILISAVGSAEMGAVNCVGARTAPTGVVLGFGAILTGIGDADCRDTASTGVELVRFRSTLTGTGDPECLDTASIGVVLGGFGARLGRFVGFTMSPVVP